VGLSLSTLKIDIIVGRKSCETTDGQAVASLL
jgi:hypothetical protein